MRSAGAPLLLLLSGADGHHPLPSGEGRISELAAPCRERVATVCAVLTAWVLPLMTKVVAGGVVTNGNGPRTEKHRPWLPPLRPKHARRFLPGGRLAHGEHSHAIPVVAAGSDRRQFGRSESTLERRLAAPPQRGPILRQEFIPLRYLDRGGPPTLPESSRDVRQEYEVLANAVGIAMKVGKR
jgi:hypothetical protein